MTTLTVTYKKGKDWRDRLYLPAYRVSEAAKYSGISTQAVSYWRRTNPERPKGSGVSYLELVEVAFVATFRAHGVSLQRIRKARDYAARMLKSKYPFAEHKWLTEGHHLMLELRELEGGALADNPAVADKYSQWTWRELIDERSTQFDYEQGIALTWHVDGRDSRVKIDPRISFGKPAVSGVSTWVLKARWEAGESIAEIQDDYRLSEKDIRDALSFEGVHTVA